MLQQVFEEDSVNDLNFDDDFDGRREERPHTPRDLAEYMRLFEKVPETYKLQASSIAAYDLNSARRYLWLTRSAKYQARKINSCQGRRKK